MEIVDKIKLDWGTHVPVWSPDKDDFIAYCSSYQILIHIICTQ